MESPPLILIADRNPNVRELLKREMLAQGYRVCTASDTARLFEWISGDGPPDLVVLDLDLPGAGDHGILKELKTRSPHMPVIVHTLVSDFVSLPEMKDTLGFVEKQGDSVEELKKMVTGLLTRGTSCFRAAGYTGPMRTDSR